ncbi:LacI family DNA-binding transcriptional regulator [Agaribacter flavus]|uniref:LacI family DNA-binding transcriptional regulator n=1 Tax=Agaribacter flavus TaxID=1902781 RepID=A0ABV7FQ66_9ALTE
MSTNDKKRVTSYDVAKEAGVSQSAVSRVFLEGRSVSKATRKKVLATANRMGYKPNAIARMLITKRSGMVAVIMSTTANLNYPEVLSLVNENLRHRNERLLLFTLDDEAGLSALLEQIWTFQVDGVIALAAHFDHQTLTQFKEHGIPVVLYNRKVSDQSANSVCCNHEHGIGLLIDLLIDHNHKNFLIVSGPSVSEVGRERRAVAVTHLEKKGFSDVPIVSGDYSYDSGRQALRQHDPVKSKTTAVICGNDAMALGVIDEARETFGLKIPEDLSVVGFDGINPANWYSYQLTTIKQPIEQMTKAAIDILIEQIEDPTSPAQLRMWSGKLIEGNSVAKAKS